jgi:hypothetical protein
MCLLLGSVTTAGEVTLQVERNSLYAGIELSSEGVRAAAFRIFSNKEEDSGIRLIYSDVIRFALGRSDDQSPASEVASAAAQAVQKLMSQLESQQVPAEHIYLIGSNELNKDRPEALIDAIRETTGKTLTFLDAETEVQLGIAGTIPQREKVGGAWIDNRDSSVLIEVGNESTKGGYQSLKFPSSGPPRYGAVTMNIQQGALSFANEINLAVGSESELSTFIQLTKDSRATSFRLALRKEIEHKPGLVIRKRVYLTGDIVWALATLLHPEDRRTFVPLSSGEIAIFAGKVATSWQTLLNPNLSRIRNQKQRQEIESELMAVRNTFTPRRLIAGAELLKAIDGELNWRGKKIWFARFGHFGRLLTYVRLQAEK